MRTHPEAIGTLGILTNVPVVSYDDGGEIVGMGNGYYSSLKACILMTWKQRRTVLLDIT